MDDVNLTRDNQNQPNRNFRSRRPSSSLISSTTSPLFHSPQQILQSTSTSHESVTMSRSHASFLNSNVRGGDDGDEPSSSTPSSNSSFRQQRAGNSHGQQRSFSPLGSPDSTYWSSSSVSNSYHQHRGNVSSGGGNNSNVVQDPCVVSSSTVDDIPPSPFSPEDSSNLQSHVSHQVPHPTLMRRLQASPVLHPPSPLIPNQSIPEIQGQGGHNGNEVGIGQNPSQEGSQPTGSSYSTTDFQFSSSSLSNISPLRSKIKKASSFERFSAQAQASSNSSSNNNLINVCSTNENNSNIHESNSSIMNPNTVTTILPPPRSSSGLSWDYGTSSPPKSNFVSSLHESVLPSGTKPYHIKKLVARLANALELERLEQEAATALAAANEEANSQRTGVGGSGSAVEIVNGGGTSMLASNSTSESLIPSEPLMRRQLMSRSPLNLTESSNSGNYTDSNHPSTQSGLGLPIPSRNPVISTKTFTSKKMPLTPKQKLLHRMQSGEITIPSTTPPPPPIQQQQNHLIPPQLPSSPSEQHHQHQLLLASLQQQQQLILQDTFHGSGSGLMDDGSTSPINDRYTNALNTYEAFIRSTTGEEFSDSMSKPDETNDSTNNQILYDSADAYGYYYGNILTDEIFNSNNGGGNIGPTLSSLPTSSRLIHTNMIQNTMEDDGIPFQVPTTHNNAHLEFVLGLPDSHERNVVREEELQLGNAEEIQLQPQQFLDPNELALSGGKSSQLAEISTLRNLLMMEPMARSGHDDSWISVAAAEYQNRMNSTSLRMSNSGVSSILGSNSGGSSGVLGNGNNSWMSEWPHRSWQGQGQPHDEGEQDEVMDMSVMEMEKTHLNSHSIVKSRILQHLHPNTHSSSQLSHNSMAMEDASDLVSERDLANGLPLLASMPVDLQQSFVNTNGPMGKTQIMTDPSALIMNPQHHHHRSVILEYDDEPVNLMSAVNLEQALVHHHSHTTTTQQSDDLPITHAHSQNGSGMVNDLSNGNYGNVCVGSNIIFTTTSTTSTTVATTGFEPNASPSQHPTSQPFMELMPGQDTNMDEKRIIRVKRKKENVEASSEAVKKNNAKNEKKANLIPDKPVQPKSFASLPSLLSLTRMSGNGWGVVTNRNKKIPANARFGPVEGPLKRASKSDLENNDSVYPVLAMVDNAGIIYQLDRMDDDLCNWMKFVRRARSAQEQNALVSEEDGLLYFTTCRDIPSKTELQVGYGLEYAQKYNLPFFVSEGNENSGENELTSRKSVVLKKSKRKYVPAVEKYVCFECDMSCVSMAELSVHLDIMHGNVDGFRRPKKKAIRKFYNSLNNSKSTSEEASAVELKLKEQIEDESKCYTSKRTLKKKEIERLRREQEEIPVVESSSPDIEIENKSEKQETTTPSHQREASSSNIISPVKIKCSLCYKNFATKIRLQKHMIVHSEDYLKPLKCDLCTKRFLTNSALAGHSKSHEGKCFECPLCEFSTQQLLNLKEHVQSHKNEENGSFSCAHCPKNFSCYSLVRKHIRAFHGPRLFSCEDCSMKFPTPDKLKLHELRHSSFRAYLCAECGSQFKRKDKLMDHTKKTHGKIKPVQEVTRILPAEPSILLVRPKPKELSKKILPRLTEEQMSKFTFRCQDCMIGFRRRGMLVNHLAKRHPEIDPEHVPELALPITRTAKNYFCPHCERIYKSSSKRKSHILKNHPGKAVPPQVRGKDLKAILEEKVGSTTFDLNLNEFEGAEMEQIKVTVDQVIRKEAVVGEIMGIPQSCTWCHRQYATRAKLLQHQRKFHIQLMPPEIQTPRPQKNNVRQSMENADEMETEHKASTTVDSGDIDIEEQSERSLGLIESSEKQLMVAQQSHENMYGYLITTTTGHVTNNDIETILQPEFVMSLLSQQNSVNSATSSSQNNTGPRTITLCIPSGMISNNTHQLSTNSTNHLISAGINVNGTQILTKTD